MASQKYSFDIASVAYQLRWSLAIFPTGPIPQPFQWIVELSQACEVDGIRVLEATISSNDSLMLLLSTQPQVKPTTIVQRVKGRLRHLFQDQGGVSWWRNFRLSSVGDANSKSVDQYGGMQIVDLSKSHAVASWRRLCIGIVQLRGLRCSPITFILQCG